MLLAGEKHGMFGHLRHIAHGSIRHDLTAAYFWAISRRRGRSANPHLVVWTKDVSRRRVDQFAGRRPTEERGDDSDGYQRHNHANDCSHDWRMVVHQSRLDINLQRRCGCAETRSEAAAGPRSRPRNITSGDRVLRYKQVDEFVWLVGVLLEVRGAVRLRWQTPI